MLSPRVSHPPRAESLRDLDTKKKGKTSNNTQVKMSKVTNPTIDDKGGANSKGAEVEVPNPQLYVYNLDVKVTNENLKEHFGSWGDIELAEVRDKGWGIVHMARSA